MSRNLIGMIRLALDIMSRLPEQFRAFGSNIRRNMHKLKKRWRVVRLEDYPVDFRWKFYEPREPRGRWK